MDNKQKIEQLKQLIIGAETSLGAAKQLLYELSGNESTAQVKLFEKAKDLSISDGGKVIEGVFDGQHMIGPDQKKYPVPANYASKSKLICGDVLKLIINNDGSFVFKQISQASRKKIVGSATYSNGEYRILAQGRAYKVLFASISFFKVQPGDTVTLIVSEDGSSEWGAIENIIHDPASTEQESSQLDQNLEEVQSGEPLMVKEEFPKEVMEEEILPKKDLIPIALQNQNNENTDISGILGGEPIQGMETTNKEDIAGDNLQGEEFFLPTPVKENVEFDINESKIGATPQEVIPVPETLGNDTLKEVKELEI